MNIEQYISSGIIESYVLGLASNEESNEFERLCGIYPELSAARDKFEKELEEYSVEQGMRPPAYISRQVLENIISTPVSPAEAIAFPQKRSFTATQKIRWLAAACVVLLLGIGYFVYQLQVQNNRLANVNGKLKEKYNGVDSALKSLVNAENALKNKTLSHIQMAGTTAAPAASANIYWDSTSEAVYMIVKGLAPLPVNRQYQLWALINGKPKDLGVFDATSDGVILKMKNCKKAEAFSITVEPKGGNTAPSLKSEQATGKAKKL